jgi:hypothetical protein
MNNYNLIDILFLQKNVLANQTKGYHRYLASTVNRRILGH